MSILQDSSQSIARRAATSVDIRSAAQATLPALIEALNDSDFDVRCNAAIVIKMFQVEEAIPALIYLLCDESEDVRIFASLSLLSMREHMTEEDILVLTEVLRREEEPIRQNGVAILRGLGMQARAAIPKLAEALADTNVRVRHAAVDGLVGLAGEIRCAIPLLVEATQSSDAYVRSSTVSFCENLDQEIVTILMETFLDVAPEVRACSARLLRRLGLEAAPAMPMLIEALRHSEPDVRKAAIEILGDLGTKAKPAVPALIRSTRDTDARVRALAQATLKKITPPFHLWIEKIKYSLFGRWRKSG